MLLYFGFDDFEIGGTVLFILDNFKTFNNSVRNRERAVEISLYF